MSIRLVKTIDILSYSSELLKQKGVKNPRLNAELLLCDVMNCDRIQLYLNFEKPLNEIESNKLKNHLRRRLSGEPVQYILGKTAFFGLTILVSPDVMIPRPDTEILVESVIKDIENKKTEKINILEIGCGSGCISLAIVNELNKNHRLFHIKSIDISPAAVDIARKNQSNLNISDKNLDFEIADIFNFESFNGYDYIVSNPPYISLNDYEKLDNEVKNFEPEIALTDRNDGFSMFTKICSLKNESKTDSKVFCEIGFGQKDKAIEILMGYGFEEYKFFKDLNNILRVIEFE